MAHAAIPLLIILDYLDRLHTKGETLQVPKLYLQNAFPLKGDQIDFITAKETLSRFGFVMTELPSSKSQCNINLIEFKKITDRVELEQEKAA